MIVTARQIRQVLQQQYAAGEAAALSRIVCCEILGQAVVDYYVGKDITLSSKQAQELDVIMDRLLKFEPIQYIQGYAPFLGRRFAVEPGVLIPRPETAELVEWIAADCSGREADVLDVCTGSGCIAVALACSLEKVSVAAWDVSEDALRVARENARRNGTDIDFRRVDILGDVPAVQVDVLASNPPYVTEKERAEMEPNVLRYEPAGALFVPDEDPLRFYRCIGQLGRHCLTPGGRIYFEANRTFVQDTAKLLQAQGFDEVRTGRDLSGNDRFVMARQPMLR